MLNKIPKHRNITKNEMTYDTKHKINDWLKILIHSNLTNHNMVDDINDIIRNFMNKYDIELPQQFNDDLILFLYNNSNH